MIYVDGVIFSLQSSGGISVCFSELIDRLKKHGVEYQFGCYANNNNILKEYNLFESGKRKLLPFERYFKVTVDNEVDVFHSSYYRLPKKSKGIKVVTTVHDFTYEKYVGGLSAKIHHMQKRKAVLGSDVVICISENTRNDMFKYIPESQNMDVRVIHNGVADCYHANNNKCEYEYVLFVGARGGYKNFSTLVSALALVPGKKLISVGGGEYSQKEKDLLERCIPSRYKHHSFVSNQELNDLYNAAFCLVYPSLYEGFGIPAIEAMKAGCPVIASNTSSLPDVCGDAAILLDNISSNSIAEAIRSLNSSGLRSSLVSKGFSNASNFTWDTTCNNLFEIYRS